VLDAADEIERAAEAGVPRVLVGSRPGSIPDTHDAIKTGHRGSKFGLRGAGAGAVARAGELGLDVQGLHVHLARSSWTCPRPASRWTARRFAAECRSELGWTPAVIDVGGGLGIRYVESDAAPAIHDFARRSSTASSAVDAARAAGTADLCSSRGARSSARRACPLPGRRDQALERHDDLTSRVDGGMSTTRGHSLRSPVLVPAGESRGRAAGGRLHRLRHSTASRVTCWSSGHRCPSRRARRARRAATGAYTLAMARTTTRCRPAAVSSAALGRLIRRRETLDDLLGLEDERPAPARRARLVGLHLTVLPARPATAE